MPQPPDAGYAASIDVDDSKKWILRCEGVDELPSKYREKRPDAMYLRHRFTMFDPETGVAVIDDNSGEMYELWVQTNDLTYDNVAAGKIAPTREIANALCGHRLSDDEVREMLQQGWGDSLTGKQGLADLEWGDGSEGTPRLKLLRLKPYKRAEAKSKQQLNARGRRMLEDDDEE